MRKLWVFLLILLWSMVFLAPSLAAEPSPVPRVGSLVPELQLPDLNGNLISLSSLREKKTVILTFWTTWSKSCVEEILWLQKIYDKYADRDLEILAVSFDSKTSNLRTFLSKNNISFPVLTDRKHKYLDSYCILVIPSTFLISKSGILQNIYVDFDDTIKKNLEKDLVELITPSEE